jgi:DnaJ-class molecular chaperone
MKVKCNECNGIGSYDCDSESGPYGHQITEECIECDGAGVITINTEENE